MVKLTHGLTTLYSTRTLGNSPRCFISKLDNFSSKTLLLLAWYVTTYVYLSLTREGEYDGQFCRQVFSIFLWQTHTSHYRVCHRFRLMKQDDYFRVSFDHFWIKHHIIRQLGQYWKLAQAKNQTSICNFSLPKSVKRSVVLFATVFIRDLDLSFVTEVRWFFWSFLTTVRDSLIF